jgi:hypothetical protein
MNEKKNMTKRKIINISLAGNIKSKETFALQVMDEKLCDSKILTKLVNHIKANPADKNDIKTE